MKKAFDNPTELHDQEKIYDSNKINYTAYCDQWNNNIWIDNIYLLTK